MPLKIWTRITSASAASGAYWRSPRYVRLLREEGITIHDSSSWTMRRLQTVFSILTLVVLNPLPVCAGDVDKALAAYGRGEIGTAFAGASRVIKDNPQDATAWYILGNCYIKQNATTEAEDAFEHCLALKPQGQIAVYASQALAALGQAGQRSSQMRTPARSPITDYDTSSRFTSVQSNSREAQLMAELEARIQDKEREKDEKILQIKRDSEQSINAIPEYSYYGGRRIRNRERPDQVSSIRADADSKISEISRRCNKDEEAFRDDTRRRLSALGDFANSTMQWSRNGQGNVQQTPHGTNLFVHNYVNFGLDEEEPAPVEPLKAKALPYNPQQASKSEPVKSKSSEIHKAPASH